MEDGALYQLGGVPAVVIGLVAIMVIGIVVSRLATRSIMRWMSKVDDGRGTSSTIVINLVRVLIYAVTLAIALDRCFGIDAAGIVSALGVVGIAVSLGAQQTIANVIGGLIITFTTAIRPDDWITIDGNKESRVVDTDWRSTTLEDEDGIVYLVPNSHMVSNVVAKGNPFYTIVVPFALKPQTPAVDALLTDCEEALLARQQQKGHDFEGMRPKACVVGTATDAISCEVKLYVDRAHDTRYVLRDVASALVELLQERDVMARVGQRGDAA